VEFPRLQLHLFSKLKVMISKQQNMLVHGVAKSTHLNTTTSFPYAVGDNALKSHRGLLESHA
jgi:hypothetical protein